MTYASLLKTKYTWLNSDVLIPVVWRPPKGSWASQAVCEHCEHPQSCVPNPDHCSVFLHWWLLLFCFFLAGMMHKSKNSLLL